MHSANEAWRTLVEGIYTNGKEVKPRGITCREILSKTTVIDMTRPITTARPKLGYRFMAAEASWILSGKNDVESIAPYSPHIASFSNDGIRFDGAYGPRLVDQLRYIHDTLIRDVDSRQAVAEIWRPNPRDSKDVSCTIAAQWVIRKDDEGTHRLHCFDFMRSSDAWLGWPYDVFNFSMVSAYIAIWLRHTDKQSRSVIAKAGTQVDSRYSSIDLQLGNLYLTAGSQHLYVRPTEDLVYNIPYSIGDVENVLKLEAQAQSYEPFRLEEFEHPQELIRYLLLAKDRNIAGRRTWLREFLSAQEVHA